MTTMPREVAMRRPANAPAQRSNVIEGRFTVRRSPAAQALRFLFYLVTAFLLAGLLLSLGTQNLL
ncbi:hypothetical protein AMIS_20480 [Actinoplanes missouriensis 431]|uniref:Uncharacterized protein n=1 Tax=Actinoplanes missouriensis (strain ATCC 14538 / DSM 43046 / CBS 188.64 / JCM 3121 / NBRC 102363 / NCIMB 12654 / NRRL B-3342 / UNCC 431) TaxID=512565 RepID=I0H2N1_ACTM4|nr:hypothetical protein [Actinoplanes missouriensis]KOX52761.1 hypothetical protein ADL19_16365 [Streptomyces purpurogeneiscleroticus]BAL87268.1 hypothetical protein AMIS_20480 [Actinoplanes missouriensis 431]